MSGKLETMGGDQSQGTPTGAESLTPNMEEDLHSSDDEFATISLTDELRRLSIDRGNTRFFGKSSGVVLIQTAMDMKKEFNNPSGVNPSIQAQGSIQSKFETLPSRRPEFWHFEPASIFPSPGTVKCVPLISHQWVIPKLEDPEPHYQFPDPDLLISLVDLYFTSVNFFLPLLHQPMFVKSLADNLHHRDDGFAAVVLLVASVGARYSDDPRVALSGTDALHSAGWAWFNQVQMVRRSLFSPPSLYDLQIYCVRDHSPFLRDHPPYFSLDSYPLSSCKVLRLHSHVGLLSGSVSDSYRTLVLTDERSMGINLLRRMNFGNEHSGATGIQVHRQRPS
jgi:hypothetical protein